MHLRDLDLKPGATVTLAIRAVDGAGNIGPALEAPVTVSDHRAMTLGGRAPRAFEEPGPLPKLAGAEVAILDELDKVRPDTGVMIPPQPDGYLAANHLWSAKEKKVRLQAARNEFVGFQVLIKGETAEVKPGLAFARESFPITFGRYRAVPGPSGPLPDPIVSLDEPAEPGGDHPETSQSLYVEVFVPHDATAGPHRGTLTLAAGGETLEIAVELTVWDFNLPDVLSFLPEMNCYDLPANERDFYRLAHLHRTAINRVPYSQRGIVHEGCAPGWDGHTLDWKDWDRRFGPLLDGSAFADLPRKGVPLEIFYLPMHENWPTPMEGNYNGSYWADRAFPASYREALVEVSKQFADHFGQKGWKDTLFQFFLNGKVDFKRNGWSRGSSPWLLDEPASWQDFRALSWFGAAFHEGVNAGAPNGAKLLFRCDISRPEWQRDELDGILDYYVVGGAFRTYRRMVLDRKRAFGMIVLEYGGSNPMDDSNVQAVGWSIDAWSLGADGVLPWQTIGTKDSWNRPDPLSLFYPRGEDRPPVPSIRLKAYRRGQQDVEYLTLLALATGEPRWSVGQAARAALSLAGERRSTGAAGEDAARIEYFRLRPQDLWAFRNRVAQAVSARHPAPRRKLVELWPGTRP
jgi:hypothetical protein